MVSRAAEANCAAVAPQVLVTLIERGGKNLLTMLLTWNLGSRFIKFLSFQIYDKRPICPFGRC